MIEKNVIDWLDLGEGLEKIDIHKSNNAAIFCKFFKSVMKGNKFTLSFYFLIQVIFFIQICCISLRGVEILSNDYLVYFFQVISNIFLPQHNIKTYNVYRIIMIIITIFMIVLIICIIGSNILINKQKENLFLSITIMIINISMQIILNYLIGPIICICLMAITCQKGINPIMEVRCFEGTKFILFFILSIINIVFFLFMAIIFAIFYNEIGKIGLNTPKTQISTNFELYSGLLKIMVFIIHYYFEVYLSDNKLFLILFDVVLTIINFIFFCYIYTQVYFYDKIMNALIQLGSLLTFWFVFIITIKTIFNINNVTIFVFIGWVVIIFSILSLAEYQSNTLMLNINIFDVSDIKQIEMFNTVLLELMKNQKDIKKTILLGFYSRFREYLISYPDINERYINLSNAMYLKNIYNDHSLLTGYYIIYVIYDYFLRKNKVNTLIAIHFCYFLLNHIQNPVLAIYHCSKIKCHTFMIFYYKFLLAENIKDYLVELNKYSDQNNSLKNVQFSSVILYYLYQNLLKLKIYDIVEYQIDYFDYLKNFSLVAKSSLGFLEVGKNIIKIRKQIKSLWDKINELNPFNKDTETDYFTYLENIIQNELLISNEKKYCEYVKNYFSSHHNSFYYKMFNTEISSILLSEGFNIGDNKILYTSQNFKKNFTSGSKEAINSLFVNDLIPKSVGQFHNNLISECLFYSNINQVFNEQKIVFFKCKAHAVMKIKLFVKELPNLTYGLIYIMHLEKIENNDFNIILDKDFQINGYTEKNLSKNVLNSFDKQNYGLTPNVIGSHICALIPDIIFYLKPDKNRENGISLSNKIISSRNYLFEVNNLKDFKKRFNEKISELETDVKANSSEIKEAKNTVSKLLGRQSLCTENLNNINGKNFCQKYISFFNEIKKNSKEMFKIAYKIEDRRFLNGKYNYYILTIKKDIYVEIEGDIESQQQRDKEYSCIYHSGIMAEKNIKNLIQSVNQEREIRIKIKSKQQILQQKDKSNIENEHKDKSASMKDQEKNYDNFKMVDNSLNQLQNTHGKIENSVINKITQKILDNKLNSKYSFLMRILCFIAGVLLFAFLIYNFLIENKKFDNISKYLKENSYYNKTRVSVSQMYIILIDIILIKDKFLNDTDCEPSCTAFYENYLRNSIDNIYNSTNQDADFYNDYFEILNKLVEIETNNPYTQTKKNNNMTNIQIIDLIIIDTLKLHYKLNDFLNYDENNVIGTLTENIIEHCNFYLKFNFNGFDDTIIKKNLSKNFNQIPFPLICVCICVFILIVVYSYLVYSMNNLEKFFLRKVINLTTVTFDDYLKSLNLIKSKFKNEEEAEKKENDEINDNKNNDGENFNEYGSQSMDSNNQNSAPENDNENNLKSPQINKNENEKVEEKENYRRKEKMNKRDREKKIKLAEQKRYKIRKMENLMVIANILNGVKIFFSLLLGVTYYIIQTIISNTSKSNYIEFNSILESVETVFIESYISYLDVKLEIMNFANVTLEQQKAKIFFENNPDGIYIFNGTKYTKNDIIKNYTIKTPEKSEYSSPYFNNFIMQILNGVEDSDKNDTETILYKLYNSDACKVLYNYNENNNYNETDYKICSEYWSGVLANGLQQAVIEMGNKFSTLSDEFSTIDSGEKLKEVLKGDSWKDFDKFTISYLFDSFIKSDNLFNQLRIEKTNSIEVKYYIIFYCYLVVNFVIFWILIYFAYSVNSLFNNFLNFIAIIPCRILNEDNDIKDQIAKLEKKLNQ